MTLPVVREYASGSHTTGDSFTVALSSNVASGDTVYVVHGSNDFSAAGIDPPTGNGTWTQVTNGTSGGGSGGPNARAFIGDLTVGGVQNLTIPTTPGSGHTALVAVFEGQTDVDACFGELITTASPHVFDGVNAVASASLLLVSLVSQSDGQYSTPSGLTQRINLLGLVHLTPSFLGSAELAASGATGTYSAALSPSFSQAGAIGTTFPDTTPPPPVETTTQGVYRKVPRARRVRR
jgi:hypothetical protein